MRALGQEQKERGEIWSDVKAGQRDRKEEREREREEKEKERETFISPPLVPPLDPYSPTIRRASGGIFKFCHVQV